MKTWSLDYGRLKTHYLNRFTKLSEATVRETKRLRDRQQQTADFTITLSRRFNPPERFRSHSSSNVIAGVIQDTIRQDIDNSENITEIKAASVALMPTHNFISTVKNDYTNLGACSLDSLFLPFSADFESSGIPKVDESPNEIFGTHVGLNPLFPEGVTDGENTFYNHGPNLHMVVRGSSIPSDMNMKMACLNTEFEESDDYGTGGVNVRSMGNRTPQVTVGYGYDVNGNKTPNDNDDYHLHIADYKVGPETKVWDDYKKVWVGDFPIMKGLLMDDIDSSNASNVSIQNPLKVNVLRYVTEDTPAFNYDSSGVYQSTDSSYYTIVESSDLYIEDPSLNDADKGAFVLYTNIDGRNTPLYIGCSASTENLQIVLDNE
jgi:hypothetical protein